MFPKNRNIKAFILAFSIVLAIGIIINIYYNIYYYINDDFITRDIFSGRYSGTADAHVYNIIYPFAALVTFIYSLFPKFDIWGYMMIGFIYFSLFVVLLATIQKNLHIHYDLLIIPMFVATFFYGVCYFSFTFTGAACASAAIFILFILGRSRISIGLKVTIMMLMVLSFCIRKDTFFMSLPFMFLAIIYCYLESSQKNKINEILKWGGCLAGICLILYIVHCKFR